MSRLRLVCPTRAQVATAAVSNVRNFCSRHSWEEIGRNHASTDLLM